MKRLHITPELVEAAYELLRQTRPFKRWKLPEADDVEFRIINAELFYADHRVDQSGKHIIRISQRNVVTLTTLIQKLAHEIVHMRQAMTGARDTHGRTFQRMADQICHVHSFDRGAF